MAERPSCWRIPSTRAARGDDGTIAAVPGQWTTQIVFRIQSMGGAPQPWTTRDPTGDQHAAPHLLAGGQGLVFASRGWNAATTTAYAWRLASVIPRNCSRRQVAAATWFPPDRTALGLLGLIRIAADCQSYAYTAQYDPSRLFVVNGAH